MRPDQTTRAPQLVSARLFLVAALLLIAMGVALRLAGYFGGIELWWDEAAWAIRIAEGMPTGLRPPGYVWVGRWLIELRNTEPVIRSVSLLAAVLSLPLLLAICRRAGLSRMAGLLGLFVLAVHPGAIDLAKEFKPYALELFLHLLLLWLAFTFLRTHETWRLTLLALAATLAAAFSWSTAVLYPSLFATMAVSALRRRHITQLLATVGAAAATLGVLLMAYRVQRQGVVSRPGYWGAKYDVFYVGSDSQGLGGWLLEKTYDVASFPGRLETFWLGPGAIEASSVTLAALCLIGVLAMIASREWTRAALWVGPWVVTIGLNLVGGWPYGAFRTNLFLLAYSLLVALAGLDSVQRWITTRQGAPRWMGRWVVPVLCGVYVLAFLPLDVRAFAESKTSGLAGNCHALHAIEVVYQAERDEAAPARQRRFLADDYARFAYRYYRDFHVVAREKYQGFLEERYRLMKRGQPMEEAIDRQVGRGFWLLACRPGPAGELRRLVLDRCPEVDHLQSFPEGGLLLRCRGDASRLAAKPWRPRGLSDPR